MILQLQIMLLTESEEFWSIVIRVTKTMYLYVNYKTEVNKKI